MQGVYIVTQAQTQAQPANSYTGAAVAASAFMMRDPYYFDMARIIVDAVKADRAGAPLQICDLGAGLGASTLVIRDAFPDAEQIYAVEPDVSMRSVLETNFLADQRVKCLEGRIETLRESLGLDTTVSLVIASEVMHIPLADPSTTHCSLRQVEIALNEGGVFAFNFGPSFWEFDLPVGDHRVARESGKIVTELGHRFYQAVQSELHAIIKHRFSSFDKETLWPDAGKRQNVASITTLLRGAGFDSVRVTEHLVPISGTRVVEFVRNGWALFFRYGELAKLPMAQKLDYLGAAMKVVMERHDFPAMLAETGYHPTAVIIASKT